MSKFILLNCRTLHGLLVHTKISDREWPWRSRAALSPFLRSFFIGKSMFRSSLPSHRLKLGDYFLRKNVKQGFWWCIFYGDSRRIWRKWMHLIEGSVSRKCSYWSVAIDRQRPQRSTCSYRCHRHWLDICQPIPSKSQINNRNSKPLLSSPNSGRSSIARSHKERIGPNTLFFRKSKLADDG